jgi:hypothetical protein
VSPIFQSLKRLWITEESTGLDGREALVKRFTDEVIGFS